MCVCFSFSQSPPSPSLLVCSRSLLRSETQVREGQRTLCFCQSCHRERAEPSALAAVIYHTRPKFLPGRFPDLQRAHIWVVTWQTLLSTPTLNRQGKISPVKHPRSVCETGCRMDYDGSIQPPADLIWQEPPRLVSTWRTGTSH